MVEENSKNNESNEDYGEAHFSWKFPEFTKHERGRNWYVKAGIMVVILLFFAMLDPRLFFHFPFIAFGPPNYTFAFIVLISALIILLFHQSNKNVEFSITKDGILVDDKFYAYKSIKNFYIIYEPPEVKTLYFEPKGFFSPRIPIALEDQNPVKIREILLEYIEEDLDREREPDSDNFSRFFKL